VQKDEAGAQYRTAATLDLNETGEASLQGRCRAKSEIFVRLRMTCVDGSRIARIDLLFWRFGRVQTCVRPVDAVVQDRWP